MQTQTQELFLAYNFDITGFPPTAGPFDDVTGHHWPVNWYHHSIETSAEHISGFPLSFDGYRGSYLESSYGGLFPGLGKDPAAHYTELRNLFRILERKRGRTCTLIDNMSLACSSTADRMRLVYDYSRLLGFWITGGATAIRTSVTGIAETIDRNLQGWLVTLFTDSPVWVEVPITTPGPVNLLKFDYEFLSDAGSEGIVTAFVDDQLVYKTDERTIDSGIIGTTPDIHLGDLSRGQHTIGFRLDPFTDVQSVVQISGIQLGVIEEVEPSVTESDLDEWCIAHGADEVRLTNVTAYGWACYQGGAPSQPAMDMLAFCQDSYGQDYADFLGDFYDPLSWGCFGPVELLGGLNLFQYCVDHGFDNVSPPGSTVDDWSCIYSDGAQKFIRTDSFSFVGELSMAQACSEQYPPRPSGLV